MLSMTTSPRRAAASDAPSAAPDETAAASVSPSFADTFPDVHAVILDLIELTVRGAYPGTADKLREALEGPLPAPVDVSETPETPAP